MPEDSEKDKQSAKTKSVNESPEKENSDTNQDNEKDIEEIRDDALEKAKEKFLDTHEKLIEANKDMTKPGNREYLSFYVFQNEWRPTKPIGPIIAQDKGPGPAVTNLPSTIGDQEYDVRKTRAPAFKFGNLLKDKNPLQSDRKSLQSGGPGPAKYDTRSLTNKGRDECPAPKVGFRIKSPSRFTSPGPAAYVRGEGDAVIYPHSPAFTIRPRFETSRTLDTPDPGSYTLPSTFGLGKSPYGGGPAFSMGGRLDSTAKRLKQGPGPGEYELRYPNVNRKKAPAYSMGVKVSSKKAVSSTPGPASNETHLVKFHKPATPRFTFGIRHSPFKAIPTFAPGD